MIQHWIEMAQQDDPKQKVCKATESGQNQSKVISMNNTSYQVQKSLQLQVTL